ncbi:protein roadkill-like [Temnothorax curvispinosus]|uniref:Protein roadkill-like n=1 Tax=Temnothorax curvispinosus TaxID=300111 RepID=A0A6J1PPC1_9HYME|nr:protein roadkill-like [Temnothorax curvispinosus]
MNGQSKTPSCESNTKSKPPPLLEGANQKARWRPEPHTKSTEETKNYPSPPLTPTSCRKSQMPNATLQSGITNAKKEKTHIMESTDIETTLKNKNWGCRNFARRDPPPDQVNDPPPDELTILCEVKVTLNNATSKTPRRHEAPECKPDVPKRPFKNSKFSDVTISVDGRETQAHKRTPAEQNRAFPAMLETNITEKRTSNVNIKDMNHETIVL